EAMLKQEMATVMLLFDEINRKGFEGDLVLNGLAEFFRNLLVCKDPASAGLLEVVEGMQEKYQSTAAAIAYPYLISALNILNEAEIQFKMARNKKLHVELTLIKLNFLPQALELTVEADRVVQKKRIDQPAIIKTRSIGNQAPSSILPKSSKAKLTIEKEAVQKITPPASASAKGATMPPPVTQPAGGPRKNLLDALREKYGDRYAIEEIPEAELLNKEKLQQCWNAYATQLEQQGKHASAGTFRSAVLQLESDVKFTITVAALTSQKFVEQERSVLTDYIQSAFNNRTISFEVLVEAGEKEDIPVHMRLNSKEKFEYLAERYPMVKELKDRLKLEIDY
ncbi:MAG TPA: hypothetical protein VG842_04720, partial [Sediminibacterium sp.]|nr:hypothetical protein [Sediminibacterium sp.]